MPKFETRECIRRSVWMNTDPGATFWAQPCGLPKGIQEGTAGLPVSEDDLAGFDPKRDGSPEAYIRRLMAGAGEEITLRMLRDPDGSRA